MSKALQEQYEAYPYPYRDPKDQRTIKTVMNDLALIGHYGFGGREWFREDCRVLVAGGGTGDASVHLAEQLCSKNPEAEIIHLDLSQASCDITQERLDNKNFKNVKVIKGSLLDLPKGELGKFDYINCSGVLHHLKDPNAGAQALCSALKDHGIVSIMLYGEYGRRIIYDTQKLAKMISDEGEDLATRIPLVRQILKGIPGQNPLRNVFSLEMYDNELVDRYLHSQDRAYTVPQIFEMLDIAKLKMISFIPAAQYDPLPLVSDRELNERISALSVKEQMAFAEIMHGSIDRHMFFATKSNNSLSKLPDPNDLECVPILVSGGVSLRNGKNPGGVNFTRPFEERLEPAHLKLVSEIDGSSSLGDIISSCSATLGKSEEELKTLWSEIYRVLSSRRFIVLKKP